MISPAINEVILRLFDHSSQGISLLLENLTPLFNCESIRLSTLNNEYLAANEINYLIENDWDAKENIFSARHFSLISSDRHSKILILKIEQDQSLDLILQFSEHSLLKECLASQDINELIPHIQQAVLIAEQISQQRGDIDAIGYVITHHPLSKYDNTKATAKRLSLGSHQLCSLTKPDFFSFDQSKKILTVSANDELDLDISKKFLKQSFSLTPSEAELAKLIFKGLSLQEISDLRFVSKQTIRKQLQSVFKKTKCESQEALIILIFEALLSRLP